MNLQMQWGSDLLLIMFLIRQHKIILKKLGNSYKIFLTTKRWVTGVNVDNHEGAHR